MTRPGKRKTLAQPLAGRGVSLFTAREVMYAIRPAEPGDGIRFRRVDLEGKPEIPATIAHLSDKPVHPALEKLPPRCTTIEVGGASVATIEHVVSALAGLAVTDATIELDAPEMPIFDGSAMPYVIQLNAVGLVELDARTEPIVVVEPIRIERGEAWIEATPSNCDDARAFRYTYELDYGPNPAIQPQSATWAAGDDYARELAPARTFSLDHEARAMQAAGLFKHLTPQDMLVLSPLGPIDNELRYDNEPARHKLLDLIGDLVLAGRPIHGHVRAHKAGHALNHEMAMRLVAP